MTPEQTCEVLYNILTDSSKALGRGARDRERIRLALEAGLEVDSRRLDWIYSTLRKVNIIIGDSAKDFNDTYPGDRISVQDMIDVLTTLTNFYRDTAQKKKPIV